VSIHVCILEDNYCFIISGPGHPGAAHAGHAGGQSEGGGGATGRGARARAAAPLRGATAGRAGRGADSAAGLRHHGEVDHLLVREVRDGFEILFQVAFQKPWKMR
jgi:hypothetical protein